MQESEVYEVLLSIEKTVQVRCSLALARVTDCLWTWMENGKLSRLFGSRGCVLIASPFCRVGHRGQSEAYKNWQQDFIDKHVHEFEFGEENKLVYTEIFQKFEDGVEKQICDALSNAEQRCATFPCRERERAREREQERERERARASNGAFPICAAKAGARKFLC
jgi:hypothetical protein